jgi:hypothetical protein
MSTFAAYLKGDKAAQKQTIVELLSFMTKKEIDAEFEPFAAALAKAWIYEQHPELAKMKKGDISGLGDNVSVVELPGETLGEVDGIFAKLAEYRKSIGELSAKLQKSEVALAETSAKLKETEKQLAAANGELSKLKASGKDEGDKVIVTSQAKVEEYIGKVADLLKMIEDVKKHGVVTVAAGAPAAGGAPSAEGPAAGGEPTADFGFGSDPFADEKW